MPCIQSTDVLCFICPPPPHTHTHTQWFYITVLLSYNQKELIDSEMIYEREQPLSAIELKDMYDIYRF